MKMYLSALTVLAILVGAEGNALRGGRPHHTSHLAGRWIPHRPPHGNRHPVQRPSLVSHHHVTTAHHGHVMTAHHGAPPRRAPHHAHTDPMMGFFDIMIGSMVDQNMAAQKAAKEQQAQAQAQAQQQQPPPYVDDADPVGGEAPAAPAEEHWVWTQDGVNKVNAKGVGGMLGNPQPGGDVTPKQKAMAQQYGQWDTAIREGWIQQKAAAPAAKKSLAHDGPHDEESELFAPPGPQPLEDHNDDDDVASSGKASSNMIDKDELADAYADAMADMPDMDDDVSHD